MFRRFAMMASMALMASPTLATNEPECTFKTLSFLIGEKCTSLGAVLSEGTTVFGPCDYAFAEFLEDTGFTPERLCDPDDLRPALIDILGYHAIKGIVKESDLPNGIIRVPTLLGPKVVINGRTLRVNRVKIVAPDAAIGDFVLHGIDKVLSIPSDKPKPKPKPKRGKRGGKRWKE